MDLERHLKAPRPAGHGWTDQNLSEIGKPHLPGAHTGDHKALGRHAGHTHGEPATK